MKKLVAVIFALAVVAGLAYAISQGMLPGIHHTDRHIIIRQTQRFFECLQFKEYEEAANFHNEEDRTAFQNSAGAVGHPGVQPSLCRN